MSLSLPPASIYALHATYSVFFQLLTNETFKQKIMKSDHPPTCDMSVHLKSLDAIQLLKFKSKNVVKFYVLMAISASNIYQ